MAIRTRLGKEAASNPPPARRTPSDRVVPSRVSMACTLPTGHAVAVVDDVEEARACVRELVDVGVPPADVQLATGDRGIEIHRRQRGGARLLDRIIGALPTDERSIQDEYLMQADEGWQFVVFRSHGKDQEARAAGPRRARRSRGAPLRALGHRRPAAKPQARRYEASQVHWQASVHAGAMFGVEDRGSDAGPSTLFVGAYGGRRLTKTDSPSRSAHRRDAISRRARVDSGGALARQSGAAPAVRARRPS